jgi:hypothetical protein
VLWCSVRLFVVLFLTAQAMHHPFPSNLLLCFCAGLVLSDLRREVQKARDTRHVAMQWKEFGRYEGRKQEFPGR